VSFLRMYANLYMPLASRTTTSTKRKRRSSTISKMSSNACSFSRSMGTPSESRNYR
jgi:hypothetical protein